MMNIKSNDIRSHFGLVAIPFTRELNISKRWVKPLYDEPLQALLETLNKRMSAALIAPSGTGKTMLLRTLVERLPEVRYRVHYIKVTSLCKSDFCRELCAAVEARPAAKFNAMVRRLDERLVNLFDEDSLRPVIIIDEAHDMRPDVLAMLRVVTNFEMDSRLVVSIILAGQSPLRQMLRRQELESVTRRMAYYATLRLLSRDETLQYVRHRLTIAGSKGDLFDQPAHDALYEIAGGNLRATNRLALASLEEAVRAHKQTVGAEYVAAARTKVMP